MVTRYIISSAGVSLKKRSSIKYTLSVEVPSTCQFLQAFKFDIVILTSIRQQQYLKYLNGPIWRTLLCITVLFLNCDIEKLLHSDIFCHSVSEFSSYLPQITMYYHMRNRSYLLCSRSRFTFEILEG